MRLGPRRVVGGVGVMSAVLAMSLRFGLGCGGSDEPLILLSAGLGGAPPHAASASVGSNVSTAISTGALTWPDDGTRDGPCPPKSLSLEVPYGWTEYRDWSCKCPFYVPSSKDVLPEPIQWKPCTSLPAGINCRVMDTSWNDSHKPIAIDGLNFDHNPDGSAVLGFARNTKSVGTLLIADADGPVRSAMMWTVPAKLGCYPQTDAVNEGKFLYSLHGDDFEGNSSTAEGSIGGLIDDLKPPVLTRGERQEPFIFGWTAGAKWIVRMSDSFGLYARPRTPEFMHYNPLGVTCEDVFILSFVDGRRNIARIRLDSLGPGLPPD